MSNKSFYITTTLPYVNASPHIGFAMEIVAADILARYHRELGKDVVFNTGTDEHGQKIYDKAIENKITPQEYVDEYAAKFDDLKKLLNLSYSHFIRTTDEHHIKAAQAFWLKCFENGDIYKKDYSVKYCVGCELEKTDSELEDGKCPLHANRELEIREEENYFFKFSNYEDALLKLYTDNPEFVKPAGKLKEIKSFVKNGLQDFSISRLKEKMPGGVPVPNDEDHVMYVWFDALTNYISTLGWPENSENFEKYWVEAGCVQIAGKDNLRQQSAMWQAMLMSAGVQPSKQILINGFINVDGQKMSKSIGNVISPSDMVDRYGIDGSRYLLTAIGPVGGDIDVTWERFDEMYTSALSNRLGNLVSRVAKLCERSGLSFGNSNMEHGTSRRHSELDSESKTTQKYQSSKVEEYDLSGALEEIFEQVKAADAYIDETTPWKVEDEAELEKILTKLVGEIRSISLQLQPFLPESAETISEHFGHEKISAIEPLFPRLKK